MRIRFRLGEIVDLYNSKGHKIGDMEISRIGSEYVSGIFENTGLFFYANGKGASKFNCESFRIERKKINED